MESVVRVRRAQVQKILGGVDLEVPEVCRPVLRARLQRRQREQPRSNEYRDAHGLSSPHQPCVTAIDLADPARPAFNQQEHSGALL
jgi:hypothetical protein